MMVARRPRRRRGRAARHLPRRPPHRGLLRSGAGRRGRHSRRCSTAASPLPAWPHRPSAPRHRSLPASHHLATSSSGSSGGGGGRNAPRRRGRRSPPGAGPGCVRGSRRRRRSGRRPPPGAPPSARRPATRGGDGPAAGAFPGPARHHRHLLGTAVQRGRGDGAERPWRRPRSPSPEPSEGRSPAGAPTLQPVPAARRVASAISPPATFPSPALGSPERDRGRGEALPGPSTALHGGTGAPARRPGRGPGTAGPR